MHIWTESQNPRHEALHGVDFFRLASALEPLADVAKFQEPVQVSWTRQLQTFHGQYGRIWNHLEIFRYDIWSYLQIFGAICNYMELYGTRWSYMELYGTIWSYMELYGHILSYMELYGTTWNYSELYGTIRKYLELWNYMELCGTYMELLVMELCGTGSQWTWWWM